MTDIYKAPGADFSATTSTGQSDFTVSSALGEAWAKTRGNKKAIWVGFMLYLLVVIPISFVLKLCLDEGMFAHGIRLIVVNSVDVALVAGLWMLGVKLTAGVNANAQEVYAYIEHFPRLLAAYFLISALVAAGFFLLALPGIYLAVSYLFASILIVDRKLGIWEALETSRKAVTRCWFRVFFIALAYGVILALSVVTVVGLIWTLPMGVLLKGVVYRHVFGYLPGATGSQVD